ncbi:dienelactone hydrolase family protein [Bradyrhizobium sp. NP1]|jgi:dienelactone hydrolase|uniref:dienelactone hydrolase family protein n=1 Tax=Bradyrhizobium sp. NP1 TaxID=3049772 RepID=UPI0025A634B5|nr:dienelactone hydrolase family protein [Bradyrhizobium sp. NP1]WJR79522.1 dienelactone hydrolase family protein [Bradyrhizobium sp. NP1]
MSAARSLALLLAAVAALPAGAAPPALAPSLVAFESPLAGRPPLQGYMRRSQGGGPAPAVVLLHGCDGNGARLDARWGSRIASWGYVTLTVDSFTPRGLDNTCTSGAPTALAFDAYRALDFLVRDPSVDPNRVAVLGFAQGGWLALTSVERGILEATARHKFRAAIAFYPPCLGFKDDMTVRTLILIGARDDWTLAAECRNLVEGRDDWGIARSPGEGVPISLVVYSGAHHEFDVPAFAGGLDYFGHHLEFNPAASARSVDALREFLYSTIGASALVKGPDK